MTAFRFSRQILDNQTKMFVIRLMFVSLIFNQVMSSGSGHSLWALVTYISGTTPFPEFAIVLMLDDIQVGYYDSEIDQLMRVRGGRREEEELDLSQKVKFLAWDIFNSMRNRLTLVKHRFNMTVTRVLVQQRLVGCEVLENGEPAISMFRDGTNGQEADSLMYNMTHFTYTGGDGWEYQWTSVDRTHFQMLYTNLYLPTCVQMLKHLLNREKRLVLRRVRPRVHVMKKQVVGGARLTCLATDFYPRHINLTLLRDGRPVDDGELTGGSVLPNGNGLYQVRKTLTVDEEELQRKHDYTCAASHLSLDNRLEVNWRAESSHSHRVYHFLSVPTVLLLFGVLMLVLWRRRRHREKSEEVSDH